MRIVGIALGIALAWLAVAMWGQPLAIVVGMIALSVLLTAGIVRRGWRLFGWTLLAAAAAGVGVGALLASGL